MLDFITEVSKQEKEYDILKVLLSPPGNGVFTVNTAKERKVKLQKAIFNIDDQDEASFNEKVKEKWENSLFEALKQQNPTYVMGVCSDSGGGILRGANWGPLFLRSALIKDGYYNNIKNLTDIGDVRVIPHLLHDKYLNVETIKSCQEALYGKESQDLPVSPLSLTEMCCRLIYKNNKEAKIFAIGGDHSVSYPLSKAYFQQAKEQGKKVGLIHFDAHTDLLEKRLGIDICFASWTTHILKYLDSPNLVHQIGIRSSGKDKEHWESTYGVNQHWAHEVKKNGAEKTIENIVVDLKKQEIDEIYISFDIDAIDAKYASSTGTPEPDGLLPHDAAIMLSYLNNHFKIGAADMVEIAPFLQTENSKANGSQITIETATSLSGLILEGMSK